MPPSRRVIGGGSEVYQPIQVLQPAQLPPQPSGGVFQWVMLAVIVVFGFMYFQKHDSSPSPRPDGEKVAPDVNPSPKPDDKKTDPQPQPVKKVEGRAIFLCPRAPMSPKAAQVIFDADKYRTEVGKDKFNYINPDAVKDTSEPVLKAISTCKTLGKEPPCVLWVPHSGSPAAFGWPETFEEFKVMASK